MLGAAQSQIEELNKKAPTQVFKNGKHFFHFNRFGYAYFVSNRLQDFDLKECRIFARPMPSIMQAKQSLVSVICARQTIGKILVDWNAIRGFNYDAQ